MAVSPKFTTTLLILTLVLVLLPQTAHAFGAGDIPDFAFLNGPPAFFLLFLSMLIDVLPDKAFRHGDIENILSTLAKTAGHAALSNSGGDLFGFAKSIIKTATSGPGGPKFSSGDIKKVYFGNWLRDYSQAMDIGGLSKLTAESLVLVVSVLGFMTFGFATEEFQITAERLGVYLPVEHIDNPKGYAEKEGDARQFHPKLRPPVNPRELEVDMRTGMKKYMATENEGWDTSTAHIRRVLTACIEMGRRAQGRDGPDLYEAYRLLGTGLHTLEDLLAHSNWVEIALRKMGHSQVFCHVGDDTDIKTPNGRAPPLVTGTFGGADFLFSLLGESTDKLSQASVTDLSTKMNQAEDGGNSNSDLDTLKSILGKLPGEELQKESKAYNFDPDNIAPPEIQAKLLQLLRWRDGLMRSILEKIEMIPGLDGLIDQLTNALNAYVFTVIAPWITPILQQATSVLGEGSKAVINSEDQYAVFDDPRASDPSHSLLSKDHFNLILNEPAGKIAQIVVEHSVKTIVQAWSDNNNPNQAVDVILEAFHHPYYATGRSAIQNAMFQTMEQWLGGLGEDEARETLNALTKESVRDGKNKRLGSENENLDEPGYGGCGHGAQPQRTPQGQAQSHGGGGYGGESRNQSSYSSGNDDQYSSGKGGGYGQQTSRRDDADNEYARTSGRTGSYGVQSDEYSSSRHTEESNEYGSGRRQGHHSSRRNDNEDSYGSGGYAPSYNRPEESSNANSSSRRTEESDEYGSGRRQGHHSSRRNDNQDSYTSGGNESGGYAPAYSLPKESSSASSGRGGHGQSHNSRSGGDQYGSTNQGSYESSGRAGYGKAEENQYGRGEEYGSRTESSYESSGRGGHGKSEDPSYNSGGNEYGSRNESSYQSLGRGAYGRAEGMQDGRGEESTGYGRSEESSYGRAAADSYGGGRSSGYGNEDSYAQRGEDETFGAERLNIGDDNEGQGYGRSQGHGRSEYESNY
ncbi:heterokaryon incompatibility protein Het-C-domain-containing protein [Mycena sp. CBHHK59/15]|nr:heterokaryon incompatibility protein Het-C-domain-containing protein [Mycena sp. CBHHK59/15]